MPAARLSTAFDSVTLYGEDPDIRPDIFGKIGNSGVSIATLNDAKKLPKMSRLLGNIWCKGEVHILFGDNGTGKSIWATQIADALSNLRC